MLLLKQILISVMMLFMSWFCPALENCFNLSWHAVSSSIFFFPNVSISWVPRLANMAAHSLAKWSLTCNFFGSFDWGSCPPYFASVVREEASLWLYFVSPFNKVFFLLKKKKWISYKAANFSYWVFRILCKITQGLTCPTTLHVWAHNLSLSSKYERSMHVRW